LIRGRLREAAGPFFQREMNRMERRVSIGKSMQIKGKLTGGEDLVIDGRVDGEIFLKGHKLSIGGDGRVNAAIRDARDVVVGGEMVGNITADDRVEVSASGTMRGDIKAPRVVLADGAKFKGNIDMEPKSASSRPGSPDSSSVSSGVSSGVTR
jgi:cytoskeletal protein CcmA (bactofilin family)